MLRPVRRKLNKMHPSSFNTGNNSAASTPSARSTPAKRKAKEVQTPVTPKKMKMKTPTAQDVDDDEAEDELTI